MAQTVIKRGMSKFLGLVFLILGGVLLYYGWQSHESVASTVSSTVTGSPSGKSIWLLALGAIAAVWGIYAMLRRRA